jgi:hypothetical protein
MMISLANRIRRLEERVRPPTDANHEFRVAGKARSEVDAEVLAYMFKKLEEAVPGFFKAVVETELRGGQLPEDLKESVLVPALRHAEAINRGLARRVSVVLLAGRLALTEEDLFPAGRPQVGCDARYDGEKFFLLVDSLG